MPADAYLDRMLLSLARVPGADRVLLATLLHATDLLGRVIGARLGELRDAGEPVQALAGKLGAQTVLVTAFRLAAEVLAARWEKVPRRQRPFYTPEQRFQILEIQRMLGLSARRVARLFALDESTIGRWSAEATANPGATTVGSLVKREPPVRRCADVVRHLVQRMGELGPLGVAGNGLIARIVTRAGWQLSKRTVGRMRKERRVPAPPPSPAAKEGGRVVAARGPNHVLMLDVTEIPTLFRTFTFKLVLCIDVWSRMPLGARMLLQEPTAAEVTELFLDVVDRHGPAPHLVTDQGSQLTDTGSQRTVASRGTRQRFGAVGRQGSIAIVERLFKTLKGVLRQPFRSDLTLADLKRRLDIALLWYAWHRPHMALGNATPAEAYFGLRPAHLDAVSPPRGRRGERRVAAPFELVLLDEELRLPVLLPRAA